MGANVMNKRSVIIAAVLLIVSVVSVTVFAGNAVADAWTMATTKKSDTFTSLSFVNTGKLPTYSPVGKAQKISFQIANHEATTTTYEYVALLSTGSSASVIEKGTLTLPVGQTADRTLTYSLPKPDMSAHIIVQLTGRTEYITFGTKS